MWLKVIVVEENFSTGEFQKELSDLGIDFFVGLTPDAKDYMIKAMGENRELIYIYVSQVIIAFLR